VDPGHDVELEPEANQPGYRYTAEGGWIMNAVTESKAALSLVSMYEISKILTSAEDLQAQLRAVLNLLASYMEMRRGIVAVTDGEGSLRVVAAAGLSSSAVNDGAADMPEEIAARIVAGQAPFVTENVADDPLLAQYVRVPSVLDDEKVSFIAVPIKTFGKPFGCLAIARVWRQNTHVSIGEDIRFLTMVANLLAQTVRLHERISSAAADEQTALSDVVRVDLSAERQTAYRLDNVIGASRPMQQVFAQVHLVAPTKSTIVLRGESGTGKEVVARAIHDLSSRSDCPFIKVNCAALPDTLLESELFGHEKGAFTGATQQRKGRFELAHRGTLFLDEIGDISSSFQAKLLRVLQEREFERIGGTSTVKVDVRIVCATNRNLEEAVAKGDFRADLYYRINVVPIFIPALRERRQDIPELAEHFLRAFNKENGRRLRFSEQAMRVISSCNYPGNVRELENCVYRVATMTRSDLIDNINLPCQSGFCSCATLIPKQAYGAGNGSETATPSVGDSGPDWNKVDGLDGLDELPERERLVRVMESSGWVQAKAARMLGKTPRQVGYALRKHNIDIKRL
jgi:Nif-specific regulatory protein